MYNHLIMNIVLKFQKLHNTVEIPKYETIGASGMDVRAFIEEDVELKPMERKLIPTGFKMEIPIGYEAQIRPRSGLSIKNGISLINCIGTIDADYRGEVKVAIHNDSSEERIIDAKERIGQLVIQPFLEVEFNEKVELPETVRGEGGFGSTGTK